MGPPLIVLTLTDGLPSCSTIDPREMDALQFKTSMGDKTRETASGGRLSHQEKMRGLSAAHSIIAVMDSVAVQICRREAAKLQ